MKQFLISKVIPAKSKINILNYPAPAYSPSWDSQYARTETERTTTPYYLEPAGNLTCAVLTRRRRTIVDTMIKGVRASTVEGKHNRTCLPPPDAIASSCEVRDTVHAKYGRRVPNRSQRASHSQKERPKPTHVPERGEARRQLCCGPAYAHAHHEPPTRVSTIRVGARPTPSPSVNTVLNATIELKHTHHSYLISFIRSTVTSEPAAAATTNFVAVDESLAPVLCFFFIAFTFAIFAWRILSFAGVEAFFGCTAMTNGSDRHKLWWWRRACCKGRLV